VLLNLTDFAVQLTESPMSGKLVFLSSTSPFQNSCQTVIGSCNTVTGSFASLEVELVDLDPIKHSSARGCATRDVEVVPDRMSYHLLQCLDLEP
jgi:hypothetical protein